MSRKKKTDTMDLDELLATLPDDNMGSYSSDYISSPITITSPTISTVDWGTSYSINSVIGPYTGSAGWTNAASPMRVKGDVEITGDNADISINGVRLGDRLSAIEQQLNILRPNQELEAEWDELGQLGRRYRQLEQEIKEKMEVWRLLQARKKSTDS